ncbi:MAG: MlaD family protein [Solirubrobacteraceae bacterium]
MEPRTQVLHRVQRRATERRLPMKRLVLLAATGFGAALVALIALSGKSDTYRFAAVFDTAHRIVSGQQVKIAGAPAGNVDQVQLVRGPRARIVMSIKRQFGPFHEDATCTILPEGLISENFVECSPGSSRMPMLRRGADGIPTVPVSQTTVPASLQDLLNVFSMPTDQRIQALINELGIATAARGQDLNALLERSNPALAQAQRVLAIIEAQRQQLVTGVTQMDVVLSALASRSQDVRSFVDRAATVARTTAAHRAALGQTISRLPALLAVLRPSLRSLDLAIARGTPLLANLRAAAPALTRTTDILPTFLASGTPALHSLASAATMGRRAIPVALPVVKDLARASTRAKPFSTDLNQLLLSTRNAGGFEGMLALIYGFGTASSGYDQLSHVTTALFDVLPQCLADQTAPGCSGMYYAPGHGLIPADNPACGAHQGAPWDPPTNCLSIFEVAPGIRRHKGHSAPAPQPATSPRPPHSGAPVPSAPPPSTPNPSGSPLAPVLSAVPGLTGATGAVGALHTLLGYLLQR